MTGSVLNPVVYNPATGGFQSVPAGSIAAASGLLLVSANTALVGGGQYGAETGVAAMTLSLPALSAVGPNDQIVVLDVQNNASVNNVTIAAAGSDPIAYYGSSGSSLVLDLNGAGVRLVAEGTATWRAIPL